MMVDAAPHPDPVPVAQGHAGVNSRTPFGSAISLSLAAAISLGMSRFSYALLLPAMRADLGWTYTLAGAMNTANAVGYLVGAQVTPALLRRVSARTLVAWSGVSNGLLLLLMGFATASEPLLLLRFLSGAASAWLLIAGGILAVRLGAAHPERAGMLIGTYYSGAGLGIIASALLVPTMTSAALAYGAPHGWQWSWLALGAASVLATPAMAVTEVDHSVGKEHTGAGSRFRHRPFAYALSGYFMFGVGYIGYMTFVVALLKERQMAPAHITAFYAMLGLSVMVSSRVWARVLDACTGGQAMAILCGLSALAALLPALSTHPVVAFASGTLFGGVFLSMVASSTALVRHNLAARDWPAGIAAFTRVFALGQIVGPIVVGWLADGERGLQRGLLFSAAALLLASALASRQRGPRGRRRTEDRGDQRDSVGASPSARYLGEEGAPDVLPDIA